MGNGLSVEEQEQALQLRVACEKGDHFELQRLLQHVRKGPNSPADNIDWNYKTKSNIKCSSPAHYAARGGHDKCLELLLEHGALCNQVDWRGFAPSHENCMGKRKISTMKLLLRRGGCEVNQKNRLDGWTCAHICAHDDAPELLEFVLRENAYVDSRTKIDCATPLHLACKRGHSRCMQVLIAHGADENALDAHSRPPLSSIVLVGFLTERERERQARRARGDPPLSPNNEPTNYLLDGIYCIVPSI